MSAPERVAHEGQEIGEGGVLLGVPRRAAGGDGLPPRQDMGGQRQPAEEAQQGRGGAQDGLVRPLRVPLYGRRRQQSLAGGELAPLQPGIAVTGVTDRGYPWSASARPTQSWVVAPESSRSPYSCQDPKSASARQGQAC